MDADRPELTIGHEHAHGHSHGHNHLVPSLDDGVHEPRLQRIESRDGPINLSIYETGSLASR